MHIHIQLVSVHMHVCIHTYVHSRESHLHSGKAPTTSLGVKEKLQDYEK